MSYICAQAKAFPEAIGVRRSGLYQIAVREKDKGAFLPIWPSGLYIKTDICVVPGGKTDVYAAF